MFVLGSLFFGIGICYVVVGIWYFVGFYVFVLVVFLVNVFYVLGSWVCVGYLLDIGVFFS